MYRTLWPLNTTFSVRIYFQIHFDTEVRFEVFMIYPYETWKVKIVYENNKAFLRHCRLWMFLNPHSPSLIIYSELSDLVSHMMKIAEHKCLTGPRLAGTLQCVAQQKQGCKKQIWTIYLSHYFSMKIERITNIF